IKQQNMSFITNTDIELYRRSTDKWVDIEVTEDELQYAKDHRDLISSVNRDHIDSSAFRIAPDGIDGKNFISWLSDHIPAFPCSCDCGVRVTAGDCYPLVLFNPEDIE
ncbi:hypothetical protein ADUPG1_003810, partial [Aduncisulcus paluster]